MYLSWALEAYTGILLIVVLGRYSTATVWYGITVVDSSTPPDRGDMTTDSPGREERKSKWERNIIVVTQAWCCSATCLRPRYPVGRSKH
jgi:hypothetical protein